MVARVAVRHLTRLLRTTARAGTRRGALALAALAASAALAPAQAQPEAARRTGPAAIATATVRANPDAKMLVQADELVHDYQRDRVSAVGKVHIYYDGSVLEADRVTYDRRTNRLNASGKVRFQTKDGNVIYADEIDLDADFRDGFVQSLLIETPERTRFTAARTERRGGNLTVLESGAYTACEPCKDDPQRPPKWQVKAARIIHNERERVIHYENATLELFGVPVAHVPYFWHPDPTVRRHSGFLAPTFFANDRAGAGVVVPYYWALSPHYDLTVSVAPMTRQLGPLVSAEWRHRLVNGSYSIRATGVFQQDKRAFQDSADTARGVTSPGVRNFRGSLESVGEFRINERWKWGWDAALFTDRFFPNDYSMTETRDGAERVSQVYLTGQGERSHFDLRGLAFTGYSRLDNSTQLPYIHPVLDYSYVFDKPVLGGELGLRANFVSLTRRHADFDPTTNNLPAGVDCITTINPSNCLLRGVAGDYTRFSTEFSWRRTVTSPWGVVLKSFATARLDLATRDAQLAPTEAAFAGGVPGRENLARAMPAVGMEMRWPFISVHSWGTQIFEPIAQVVVRPNETHIGKFPNEDAQSLVFDDTNLFAIDKYSGYDRVEGGTRANVGVQYTANIHRYGTVNALFGQSYHLAGRNSYAYSGVVDPLTGRQTGLGLQSGLEHDVSDYVARIYYQPTGNLSFAARARFDRNDFSIRRLELETRSNWGELSLATIYARYEAQPLIGYTERREGLYQTAALRFHENWSVFGGGRYDIRRSRFDLGMIGVSYVDECIAASLSYVADYSNLTYTRPVHRIMLRLNLRTIGGTALSTRIGSEQTGP